MTITNGQPPDMLVDVPKKASVPRIYSRLIFSLTADAATPVM